MAGDVGFPGQASLILSQPPQNRLTLSVSQRPRAPSAAASGLHDHLQQLRQQFPGALPRPASSAPPEMQTPRPHPRSESETLGVRLGICVLTCPLEDADAPYNLLHTHIHTHTQAYHNPVK